MSIFIRLRKDKMGAQAKHHKYYAHTVTTGDVTTEELAEKLQQNTTFSRGEVRGLIDDLVREMKWQLSNGHVVCLDGFGRFRLSVESEGAETPADFDIQHDIKRVKCKFLPAGTRGGRQTGPVTQLFGKDVQVKWYPGEENGKGSGAAEE
ncbi:MAG: HU family DNA-binding protein [Prevotella sp.]|nr:HU family DNA-binding protein [Prevotella sp.]